MKFIIGMLVFFVGVIYVQFVNSGWNMDGAISDFIDGPAIILIVLSVLGVIIVSGQFKDIGIGIKSFYSNKNNKKEIERALVLYNLLFKTIISAGFISFLANIIGITSFHNNEIFINDISLFWGSLSVALLGIYYAIIINLIFINPIIAVLKKRLTEI